MILLLESYSDIIKSYDIQRYRQYGGATEFIAVVQFVDNSELHIRDYLFLTGERKYSFHWQSQNKKLISRWDNSPHHKEVNTSPYHLHTCKGIKKSKPMTLKKVLATINEKLREMSI